MNFRYTKSQVARGAFADSEKGNEIHVFKNVLNLRATYQMRLLLYRASEEGKKLVLHVPKQCAFDPLLNGLLNEFRKFVRVVRVEQ